MMFGDAIKSLRRDFSRSFFYWLTFTLSTAFIFLFFAIATGEEVGIKFIGATGGLALNVTFFVVTVCMIDVFFANDFFVKTKSRDLAIQLICGATFMQLAGYLLSQTFLLLLIAIPVGITAAFIMMPIMNVVMSSYLNANIVITINASCFWATLIVLFALVFWTTYLNVSYAYRNNALTLLNDQQIRTGGHRTKLFNTGSVSNSLDKTVELMNQRSQGVNSDALTQYNVRLNETPAPAKPVKEKKVKRRKNSLIMGILSLALFIVPLVLMNRDTDNIMLYAVAGMLGFLLSITNAVLPFLDYRIDEQMIDHPRTIAALGFLRTDLKMMRSNMILIVLSSVILISILITSDGEPMSRLLILVSYVTMNVLLSSAIMFRFSTDIFSRKKYYQTMSQIGYLKQDLKKIIVRETSEFYGFVTVAALLYIETMFYALISHGLMDAGFVQFLTLAFLIPMIICYIITVFYYFRAVTFKEEK